MKLVLATCMFGRPKVSELFLLNYFRLKKDFDIDLIVAASDVDSENLCKSYGVKFFPYNNLPLGEKHNVLFHYILTKYECDYIIHCGDDDLISTELFSCFVEEAQKKTPYFGTNKIYFYEPKTGKAIKFTYPIPNKPIGAYRWFSADLLKGRAYRYWATFRTNDTLNRFKEGERYELPKYLFDWYNKMGIIAYDGQSPRLELWQEDLNRGLDNSSESRLLNLGIIPKIIETERPQIVDVKSSQNIWPLVDVFGNNGKEPSSVEEVTSFLSEEEKIFIKKHLIK